MKKFNEFSALAEGYKANTKDEQRFIDKHVVTAVDYPVKNEHGLPFRDDRIQTKSKKKAGYHANEDTDKRVYEASIVDILKQIVEEGFVAEVEFGDEYYQIDEGTAETILNIYDNLDEDLRGDFVEKLEDSIDNLEEFVVVCNEILEQLEEDKEKV
jgi:hypothetical protein